MGTKIGHTGPGFGFLVIGLWHLYNHTKLYAKHGSRNYRSLPWFPSPYLRHLELYLIMMGAIISVAMELFIGPQRHQPLDHDGTIPSNHLHNFEHASISLTFLVYSIFALVLDSRTTTTTAHVNYIPRSHDMLQVVGSIAFAQQLLLFHLHSTDHMGVEGQYHWLLQLVIFVSLCTTLLSIGNPRGFFVSYVRSLSILFQGVWLIVMGYMLWTPGLIPKGCFINVEEGHQVVRCHGEEWQHRAKALVNIQFSWFLIGLAVFAVSFYILLMIRYFTASPPDAQALPKYMRMRPAFDHDQYHDDDDHEEEEDDDDIDRDPELGGGGGEHRAQLVKQQQDGDHDRQENNKTATAGNSIVSEMKRFIHMQGKASDQRDHVER